MKIEADVVFNVPVADYVAGSHIKVNVDADYVEADAVDVANWVQNELYDMFGRSFGDDEFEITNLEDVVEDLKFDEFKDKTQYSDM